MAHNRALIAYSASEEGRGQTSSGRPMLNKEQRREQAMSLGAERGDTVIVSREKKRGGIPVKNSRGVIVKKNEGAPCDKGHTKFLRERSSGAMPWEKVLTGQPKVSPVAGRAVGRRHRSGWRDGRPRGLRVREGGGDRGWRELAAEVTGIAQMKNGNARGGSGVFGDLCRSLRALSPVLCVSALPPPPPLSPPPAPSLSNPLPFPDNALLPFPSLPTVAVRLGQGGLVWVGASDQCPFPDLEEERKGAKRGEAHL